MTTNTISISEKERRYTDKACILPKTLMSRDQFFSLTSLSRLFHSYPDEPIGRWGGNGSTTRHTRKQNLTCLTCGQCRARTYTRHSCEMTECLRALKFSGLFHSATGAARSPNCLHMEWTRYRPSYTYRMTIENIPTNRHGSNKKVCSHTNLWTSSTIPCVFIKKTSLSVRRVNVAAWPSITLAICRINIYHYTKVRIHIPENHC